MVKAYVIGDFYRVPVVEVIYNGRNLFLGVEFSGLVDVRGVDVFNGGNKVLQDIEGDLSHYLQEVMKDVFSGDVLYLDVGLTIGKMSQ